MNETITNLIVCLFALIIGIVCLTIALFTNLWWNYILGFSGLLMGYALFIDDSFGVESVKHFLTRKLSK
jgi:hypothetical protein